VAPRVVSNFSGLAAWNADASLHSCEHPSDGADGACSRVENQKPQCTSLLDVLPSCLGRNRVPDVQALEVDCLLPVGARVQLVGLQKSPYLNGRLGEVVGFNGSRYKVILLPESSSSAPLGHEETLEPPSQEGKLLKKENLVLLEGDGDQHREHTQTPEQQVPDARVVPSTRVVRLNEGKLAKMRQMEAEQVILPEAPASCAQFI